MPGKMGYQRYDPASHKWVGRILLLFIRARARKRFCGLLSNQYPAVFREDTAGHPSSVHQLHVIGFTTGLSGLLAEWLSFDHKRRVLDSVIVRLLGYFQKHIKPFKVRNSVCLSVQSRGSRTYCTYCCFRWLWGGNIKDVGVHDLPSIYRYMATIVNLYDRSTRN